MCESHCCSPHIGDVNTAHEDIDIYDPRVNTLNWLALLYAVHIVLIILNDMLTSINASTLASCHVSDAG